MISLVFPRFIFVSLHSICRAIELFHSLCIVLGSSQHTLKNMVRGSIDIPCSVHMIELFNLNEFACASGSSAPAGSGRYRRWRAQGAANSVVDSGISTFLA